MGTYKVYFKVTEKLFGDTLFLADDIVNAPSLTEAFRLVEGLVLANNPDKEVLIQGGWELKQDGTSIEPDTEEEEEEEEEPNNIVITEIKAKISMLEEDLNEYDGDPQYYELFANKKRTEISSLRISLRIFESEDN